MRVVMGTERVVAPVALAARTATPERAGETTGVDAEGTTEAETGVGGRAVMISARETAGGAATAIVAGTVATIGADRAGAAGATGKKRGGQNRGGSGGARGGGGGVGGKWTEGVRGGGGRV